MSALDVALYENALMRVRTVAEYNEEKTKQAVEKAVEKAVETSTETVKTEATKKLLLLGLLTIEQIAQVQGPKSNSPEANAGLRMLEASIVPPLVAPAPTMV